jgi:murein L,D-transpeptidase YcbB/YkuD
MFNRKINWNEVRITDFSDTASGRKYSEKADTFYQNRNYSLAWFSDGKLNNASFQLIDEIRNSENPGLEPENYNLFKEHNELLNKDPDTSFLSKSPDEAAHFDLLLTDAYIAYASDLSRGRITTDSLFIKWENYPEEVNLPEYLATAIENNSVIESLHRLRPHNNSYYRLIDAYNQLRNSDWPLPGSIKPLKKSSRGSNVIRVKKFLATTGDLEDADSLYLVSPVFDVNLEKAVMKFQKRHGLKADGVAGVGTIEEMNVPLTERLNQILVNIDRFRSLPPDMGNRYIAVNIPGYYMEYYENDSLKIKMNVVVGEIENYTPVLKDTMSYIVFNPEWNVPESIVKKEMIPEIKKDVRYLAKNNYVLLKGSYNSPDTINPSDINWQKVDTSKLSFRIIQMPGKNNALGRMKFMFPNNNNIYLHDTPSGSIFNLEKRDISHGCVRLEKPVELARLLLHGQPEEEDIDKILSESKTVSIPLKNKVMVQFMYNTAWVDDDGLQFRKDIYFIDSESAELLKKNTKN